MPSLIVIRIVPQAAIDPDKFVSEYLDPPGLGPLQITAFDLSFNSPTAGQAVGTATYIGAAATAPSPTSTQPANVSPVYLPPQYAPDPTTGMVQQYDLWPPQDILHTAFFSLSSVATVVIEVASATAFENLRLVAQWGSGTGAPSVTQDFYDVTLAAAPPPDLNSWSPTPPTPADPPVSDPWGGIEPPTVYFQLPPAPAATNAPTLQLSADGTPPAFGALLTAVEKVLDGDPGTSVTVSVSATAAAGSTTLQFPAGTAGIGAGMAVSAAGIPTGTTVLGIDATGLVTLNQQLSAAVNSGTAITFAPALGALSFNQCKNIAYEIVWSQQPPPPSPPDPVEDLYTNPPNTGPLLSPGSSGDMPSPNLYEGDRQQFEAKLNSYYTVANSTADRLTNFVFSLSAAIACQQQSLAATQALIEFPVEPGSGFVNDVEAILTGLGPAGSATNFGVPAAYFYALAATMPPQVTVPQRYSLATRETLTGLLADLTAAINAGVAGDGESFAAPVLGGAPPAGNINAAQAARRLAALNVPSGITTLAPLDTIALSTAGDTASGRTLTFASVSGINAGMSVAGPNIAPGATVASISGDSVTLPTSAPVLNDVPAGSEIVFTPPYPAGMASLIQAWLGFPAVPGGAISSVSYQPGDDDSKFWPGAANAQPAAFLNLVLCALTQGAMLPAPFTGALGDAIVASPILGSPTSVTALAAVTGQHWTDFFTANPTWLPSFTQPGDTTARIAAFIRAVQKFFAVASGGPSSPFVLATSLATAAGDDVLHFPPTTAVAVGMSVSGAGIAPGTTVASLAPPPPAAATSVTLSQRVTSAGVSANANITFSLTVSAGTGAAPPALPGLAQDWFSAELSAYGTYTLGAGFDLPQLQAAAATVFAGDPSAQAWLVEALVALDALYKIVQSVPPPAWVPVADAAAYTFSVVEALYARGFTSAARITELSTADFPQALAGTVAYDLAAAIYASAAAIAPPAPPAPPVGGFQPVNPDGTLTNCIPPPCSSPLGPVAYLSELLKLSPISTCATPAAAPLLLPTNGDTPSGATLPFVATTGIVPGMLVGGSSNIPAGATVASVAPTSVTLSQPAAGDVPDKTSITFTPQTLALALAGRRGPLGNLAASCANLETPLPLIDIANECLEYMASQVITQAALVSGTVYDTSADVLAGHALCRHEPCPEEAKPGCHDPARLFAALPEYSTPAVPVAADSSVEPLVWNTLKSDFSTCRLPYSQALDVSRSYLRHFGSCRFEEMRTFRKCITEFVLDPVNEPVGFADYLWRYPVRIDIAREYLGITPEEYALLFMGAPPPLCGKPVDRDARALPAAVAEGGPWQLYGFAAPGDGNSWIATVVQLPEFLARTCLTYCEFYELWAAGFVPFHSSDERAQGAFPQCEPCCLEALSLQFPAGARAPEQSLAQLAVFIRLWRKLKEQRCLCLSFAELRDVCDVLQLFTGGAPNPDFVRQLAAFQMLREEFRLEIRDPHDPPAPIAVDADRTQILALWVGPAATKWGWAVRELCEKAVALARHRGHCEHRTGDFAAVLATHLDALSKLCGFDPASAADNWHALPTHTLRLAEILAKITQSRFRVAELLYLFTAAEDSDGSEPFPLQGELEAQELPLGLPDDEAEFSLWRLRRELLAAAGEVDADDWHWRRVADFLEDELGFAAADVVALAQHVFPHVLERDGHRVDAAAPRYITSLPTAKTTPAMWTGRAGAPFQYDAGTAGGELWVRIPIADHEVVEQLTILQSLNADEQVAVQDLYFQPRAMLVRFALLFSDFAEVERHLIEESEGERRWHYFRRHVALCHRRCRIIAAHLSGHVAHATRQQCPEDHGTALLILRQLLADENEATASWENDAGTPPAVVWTGPNGSAFAALLGLVGTGLVAEYKATGGALAWRGISGALDGFGTIRDRDNAPLPTVLPSFAASLPASEAAFLDIRNGYLLRPKDGDLVGGAEGFDVTWSGALLVEEEGTYEFWAGAPTPCGEKPNWEAVERCRWRAVLKRGARSWVILSHQWPGEEERLLGSRLLRRGAYELCVELVRPDPDFASADRVHRVHAGFEIKYAGPDSCGERVALPRQRLFAIDKQASLGAGLTFQSPAAASFLATLYASSLRDIRRTYQRAFKALLFARRLGLAGRAADEEASELGFMLENGASFAGAAYYRGAAGFTQHLAKFDFNFLPIADDCHPPAGDARTKPSPQRTQAMFDWWERLFDYAVARDDIRRRHDRTFWHLFAGAEKTQPADPASLLAAIGVGPKLRPLGLRYYAAQTAPVYSVTGADLEDERWGIRVWHAERWLGALEYRFAAKDIAVARPDLWASDDPAAVLAGETASGNANLCAFVDDGFLETGEARRYDDLRRLNDGRRERGRDALVSWLCALDRVALPWLPGHAKCARDLSDLLLLDVETGLCERASRIEEAVSAVQAYIRRARLHLEPGWIVSRSFAHLWDSEFATFEVWRACKERLLYKENWIEWEDLRRARGVEAFRTLEAKLRQSELAIAAPGGGDWWPGEPPRISHDPNLLQAREPSRMAALPAPHEGLDLLGTPEYAARPSWLALVPAAPASGNGAVPSAAAGVSSEANGQLPLWMETAVRLGTRFWRIAAAGTPPGAAAFAPHPQDGAADCVSCCAICGCEHPLCLDEYYFWLVPGAIYEPQTAAAAAPAGFTATGDYQNGWQDDFYDPVKQTSTVWQDSTQLPQLLAWPSSPTVRLAWCRLHNGQFGQPRRSAFGVRVDPASTSSSDLQFLGRVGDSLTFAVTNGLVPPGHADASAPGFRYDIAADNVVVLPQVAAPTPPPTFLGALDLPAYPYFLFFAPGAPLYPLSPFSPSLLIATAMRAHCRFEAALAWYREAFDPLRRDCTWIDCQLQDAPRIVVPPSGQGACCDAAEISCDQARDRAVVLHYLETLVEWSDALRHRGNSPEAFQQAWALLDVSERILGRPPRPVRMEPPTSPPNVASFTPAYAPLNPRLVDLYETVADRLALIRTCQSSRRLPDRCTNGPAHYFGNDPAHEGWRGLADCCGDGEDWCRLHSPYRFAVLIQKAQDYAGRVEQFGAAFQAAVEKGDAELLASLRAGQEREILSLGLAAQEDTWRDADWAIEALQKTKAISQTNLNYYQGLIQAGLIGEETLYQDLTIASTVVRGVAETTDASSGASSAIGNFFTGVAGFGGTPLTYAQLPPGSPAAGSFAAGARILIAVADALSTTAGLELTEAGWTRRLQEWNHQVDVLTIEIQQIERQILAAQRRRGKALKDLDTHQRQIEHATEAQNFLRDKFTAPELYIYLQKETAALHRRMYELALDAAREAQHAFNLERGHTTRHFLPDCAWDDLHQGLLAGERLGLALRHMEKTYLDENVREHELTKHLSLRLHFPLAFLDLRTTGCCEIDIPEWMFDLDYPGHFMRRIRNLTVTIPCVTGPFTGVHCRLTLLAGATRIDPRKSAPAHECCCPQVGCDECDEAERLAREYLPCADDPRIVRQYGAREAIATSAGRDDSGMFQLDFNDQRYLPFEYMGAVSRWRIELPPENNYFDPDTLTDFIVRLGYTAREGGEPLRQAAFAAARRHLPGDGWRFFEVRHEFPDAWQQLRDAAREEGRHARLLLRFERRMFPFIPQGREITLDGLAILFGARQDDDDCPEFAGCPCPEPRGRATRRIEVRHEDGQSRDVDTVLCRASEEWSGLYCGVFAAGSVLGDGRRQAEIDIRFSDVAGEIGPVFLLCRYATRASVPAYKNQIRVNQPSSALAVPVAGERIDRTRGLTAPLAGTG